jgi:hypothetical protein
MSYNCFININRMCHRNRIMLVSLFELTSISVSLIFLSEMSFSNNQMVNTRSGGGQDVSPVIRAHIANQQNPVPPPPPNLLLSNSSLPKCSWFKTSPPQCRTYKPIRINHSHHHQHHPPRETSTRSSWATTHLPTPNQLILWLLMIGWKPLLKS